MQVQEAECRVQLVPVPGEPGEEEVTRVRVEAESLERCQREIDRLGDLDGVAMAEFTRPAPDRATGLWVSYGLVLGKIVDDDL